MDGAEFIIIAHFRKYFENIFEKVCKFKKALYICIVKQLKQSKMKVEITKMQKVDVPVEYQKEEGCVAFQLVKVVIDFYGKLIEDVLDTKILQDGRQIVTNGNGYIKAGYEI